MKSEAVIKTTKEKLTEFETIMRKQWLGLKVKSMKLDAEPTAVRSVTSGIPFITSLEERVVALELSVHLHLNARRQSLASFGHTKGG